MEKTIFVYENWSSDIPMLIGRLYVDYVRNSEIFSFEYDNDYLKQERILFLDPDIGVFRGRQRCMNGLFGVFSDSCPDRWGRFLMQKREQLLAAEEDRHPQTLMDSDFLLGVHDESRMGALRFSLEENGEFLAQGEDMAAPPWTTLRDLQEAARHVENKDEKTYSKWIHMLVSPGSSLGGARPKATVKAPDGTLWIAKFPSQYDSADIGAWEMTVHTLAKKCGLHVPEARLEWFSDFGSTFLVKRFDRDGKRRIHFASAMTMLGKKDGDHDASYLDLADFLHQTSGTPQSDLKELWSRVAFNCMVSNVDDHLRNHGFLLINGRWRLSPMYDVNPDPDPNKKMLSLCIDDQSSVKSLDLVRETAEFYGIRPKEVEDRIKEMAEIIAGEWRKTAKKYGLRESDMDSMSYAFSLAETAARKPERKRAPLAPQIRRFNGKGRGR